MKNLPSAVEEFINKIKKEERLTEKHKQMFETCMHNTFLTTVEETNVGDYFVITGDIPAMWLRDSAGQLRPFLYIEDETGEVDALIAGVIRRQFFCITIDPYANAFNKYPSKDCYHADTTEMNDWLWERKYEIDSLCYPLQTAYLYWKKTDDTSIFDSQFLSAVEKILTVFEKEQYHMTQSNYSFERADCVPSDTLPHQGKGNPVSYTGMTWSGFRPSDDACKYGYLVPANMFAVVELKHLIEILSNCFGTSYDSLIARAKKLASEIESGIQDHAIVNQDNGKIYAYETDGNGNYNIMDDANVPSLLSLPYLGYCEKDDIIYKQTRKAMLSTVNPYYYAGKYASGIGSPHTPTGYIWHIALAMQLMTATEQAEKEAIMSIFETTDADKRMMHEGFNPNNPSEFTRDWFSWSNSMYCEAVLDYLGFTLKG